MKRTNTNEYKNAIFAFLLDAIESEKTDREKVEDFFTEFSRVADHPYNLQRLPNTQDRLADYLQGLPSNFSVPIYNGEIVELAEKLHECKLTDKQAETVLSNYWNHLAYFLLKLREKLNK